MGLFSGIRSYFNKSTDYFKQAKINQEDVVKGITNTVTSSVETAQDSLGVAIQIVAGTVTYNHIAGKIMTTYSANAMAEAMGASTPTIFNKIVNGAASFIFKYPATALASTIGAVFFATP